MARDSNYAIEMYGDYSDDDVKLISGVMDGGINQIPVAQIEFVSRNRLLDLGGFVGSNMGFSISGLGGRSQMFYGTCISAEFKGAPSGDGHYFAEIRPWLWFLTRSTNNRIFQNIKTTDIVQEILGDYGFSGDLKINHSGADPEREYCVQYRETDLDFIQRLLEEDGIYFYFEFTESDVKMVLADSPSTHSAVAVDDKLSFRDDEAEQQLDHIYAWEMDERVTSGKVTLDDYDFTKPNSDLTASPTLQTGKHSHNDYEVYSYPGGYQESAVGDKFAAYQIEAIAAEHQVWKAKGNVLNAWVGQTFELLDHPRHTKKAASEFMITRARQFFRLETGEDKKVRSLLEESIDFGLSAFEHTGISFDAVLKTKPFRVISSVKKPEISGVQTAVVTGASGDEITTDKYGRIKVKFHWDRDPKKDDTTTCWVRTMMPWTGKNWGFVALPRVGQEVVIQFEEGDPDRPLCVGMLYNADTMPPYELPTNATRSGVMTNSSKGGGGYNELMFEDKKGDELIRLEAEKDFVQTVQNSSHIKVGYDHPNDVKMASAQDERSMKLEVENHLDEIVEKGDHSFKVSAGKQTIDIKKDKAETIEGGSVLTVTKDVETTSKTGDISIESKAGKIDITAAVSITLKVGANSVKIDQKGVAVNGMMVKIEGKAMLEAKAPMTTVKGDATLILKGGVTLIN